MPCANVDDPRWAAAPLAPIHDGSGPQTAYRVIFQGGVLRVAFRCELGTDACNGDDRVYFAWQNPGEIARILRITTGMSSSDTNVAPDSHAQPATMRLVVDVDRCVAPSLASGTPQYERAGIAFSDLDCNLISEPVWGTGQQPAVWRTQNGWAVHLEIANVNPMAKVAVGTKVSFPATSDTTEPVVAVWPPCLGQSDCYEEVIPKNPDTWATLSTGCPGVVEFSSSRIGAQTASTSATTCSAGGFGNILERNAVNNLVACPEGSLSTNTVKATFRLAKWGSVAGPGSWEDIGSVQNTGGVELLTTPWTATLPALDGGAAAPAHQCMMVQLGAGDLAPAGEPHFSPAVVYRNMEFQPASLIQQTARIELKTADVLKLTSGPQALLYLYVQQKNMPGPGSPSMVLPLAEMDRLRTEVETGTLLKIPTTVLKDPPKNDTVGLYRLTSLEASLERLWPTYKVHPFIYAGRKTLHNGQERDLVFPLPPFGLYVRHEGAFKGFRTQLKVDGQLVTRSGQVVATNPRPVEASPIIEVPVEIETLDDEKLADPATDGGVTDGPATEVPEPAPDVCESDCCCNMGGATRPAGTPLLLMLGLAAIASLRALGRRRRRP